MTRALVVDTSVLIAIIEDEPGATAFVRALEAAESRYIAAPSALEAMLVLGRRRGPAAESIVASLLATFDIELVSFGQAHLALAFRGFTVFGKGQHPASLNFGDCMAYALAMHLGLPLLFKGADFKRCDVEPVPA